MRSLGGTGSLTPDMKHDSLINILRQHFAAAIADVTGLPAAMADAMVRAAGDPKFGDYQCNVAMSLARLLKAKPRDIAERIVAAVQPALADIAESLEIAGPGFINIRLKDGFLAQYLAEIPQSEPGAEATGRSDRLGLPPVEKRQKVVIDYSSPNTAKQMHVGHVRSMVIGDVFARVLGFEGHEVVRQNHIGDWGTQFGMLIEHYRQHALPTPETHADVLQAIESDYKAAQQRFKDDEAFRTAARLAVGRLQSGDPGARRVWQELCQLSRQAFVRVYERMNVLLDDGDVCGESFYNDRLGLVVAELRGLLKPGVNPRAELREDEGAQCIFLSDEQGQPLYKKPDGEPLPMIIQKSDGAYLYATTDLAALRYRIKDLGADRVIYVTDARQKLHFEMLFAVARAAGWAGDDVKLEHVYFGSILGDNRRPLKTREGENVKLAGLLDEAERRALALLEERDQGAEGPRDQGTEPEAQARVASSNAGDPVSMFTDAEKREIARRVGIAAVKYADLRGDRTSDYVFGWDKMLAMQGNTAPYMMYAYARIRSIYRKAAEEFGSPDVYAPSVAVSLGAAEERALALRLARLRETIDTVAADLEPHTLCGYLYDMASDFMRFYEACPVVRAADESSRLSRMRLCDLTARTLELGLGLLGIEVIERM